MDDAEDLDASGWGGVVPLIATLAPALADAHAGNAPEPASIAAARAKFAQGGLV